MWFHLELKGNGYSAARYGVAVSDNVAGPYKYIHSGRVNPNVYPINIVGKDTVDVNAHYADLLALKWWTPEWYDAVKKGLFVKRDLQADKWHVTRLSLLTKTERLITYIHPKTI